MSNINLYQEFLARKLGVAVPHGFDVVPDLPPYLFDFQRAIVARHLRLGRSAIFAGTGLGKTGMQLAWADAVATATQGEIILAAPLAVGEQTVREAAKFGIPGVRYAGSDADRSRITVTNYERVDRFDPDSFSGVSLDESSILKSHDSATRAELTRAFAAHAYKLANTATPAPNDWTELGNHAEFLGVCSAKEMLSMYFVHDGSIRAGEAGSAAGWRLKRHAEDAFWRWVASWATVLRHPRDVGFEHPGYDLPPLHRHLITVDADYTAQQHSGLLFPMPARTLKERLAVRRDTLSARVAKAAEIVNAEPGEAWLIWCNLNDEASGVEALIPAARQVKGPDSHAEKVKHLLGFVDGLPRCLITKPSIAGHGMNWQHCARMVFVGLNDSFEQLFQALRRCWRFGQTRPVHAYFVASELEGNVVSNLLRKEADDETMMASVIGHVRSYLHDAIVDGSENLSGELHSPAAYPLELPSWL